MIAKKTRITLSKTAINYASLRSASGCNTSGIFIPKWIYYKG